MIITKPKINDLRAINNILIRWTEKEEAEKYIERIGNEIKGKTEFNMQFWVASNTVVLGVIGLSDPLPILERFFSTNKPGEIKILYVDEQNVHQGIGKTLTAFLENEAINQGYTELFVRSAQKYKFTAWEFYKRVGYKELGSVTNEKQEKMKVFNKILFNQ